MLTLLVVGSKTAVGESAEPTAGGARLVSARAAEASTAPAPIEKMSWSIWNVSPVVKFVAVVDGPKPFQAVFINRAFTWSGVREGVCCKTSAATPQTTGVAMLVPLNLRYWDWP